MQGIHYQMKKGIEELLFTYYMIMRVSAGCMNLFLLAMRHFAAML